MKLELPFSESATDIILDAVQQSQIWSFDAINSVTLVSSVLDHEESTLRDYFMRDIMDPQEINDALMECYSTKVAELEVDEMLSKKDGSKQDKSGKKQGKDKPKKQDKKKSGKNKSGKDKRKKGAEEDCPFASQHDGDVTFINHEGSPVEVAVSKDVLKVFEALDKLCVDNEVTEVKPIYIVVAMFQVENEVLRAVCKEISVSYLKARKFFTDRKIFSGAVIPYNLSAFLTCLNDGVDVSQPCEILMRDEEVDKIWNISLKKNKRNTVIVGEAGVGKSALVEKITYDIVAGTCPERFKGFNVISLDVNSLIAGTSYRGDAEERIKDIIEFLKHNDNVILFIDEVHTILGAGSCFEGEMDLANALKPILARGETIVIGATTNAEYTNYFASDAALSRRFEKIEVEEPEAADVYPMIRNKIRALSKFHGVKINKAMVEYAILIAGCFAFEKKNPDKTLDLIDRSMVVAYRRGKKYVSKDCILANFGIYYKLWDGMDEDSRKEVAYHEAGHYLVGKASSRLNHIRLQAVSIMPTEDYLGVTVYEPRKDKVPYRNMDFFIDEIAFDLGGRVAESVFRGDYTSGAGQDLKSATETAFYVVSKLGMTVGGKDSRAKIYTNSESAPMLTERNTNNLTMEVQQLLEAGYKRAEEIIEEYKELLEMIAKALLKNRIMSEDQLDKIWRNYMQKKAAQTEQ